MKRLPAILAPILTAALAGCHSPSSIAGQSGAETSARLVVETAAGDLTFEPRNVANGSCSSDDCVDFRRVDQAPVGYALIHKLYHEGSEYLLIDTESGAQLTLPAEPNFSSSGSHLIVVNPDETGDGSGSGSFVYERGEDGAFAQQARFGMEDFAATEFAGWVGPDCANIRGYTGWGKPGFDTSTTTDASLVRSADGSWTVSLKPCSAAN
ncbi:hypothetical protein [Erythrobacter sp. JK5]|uniref:hypothetical protein n=1 Tax=Erythrobacter sp. JK5 TaxID=2829500 RepID=UPI001BAD516C|nr:hypothetical protein [Erythrobacter sp. JK5]QUL38188.1 hypothetical protein KDC96_01830 [Erythrobacter sp. JK5]